MRCLAVGDIHGCYDALVALASYVPFKPEDRVITLGDYVNRGPGSRAVLDWLIAYGSAGSLVPLRGNHDASGPPEPGGVRLLDGVRR